MAVDGGTTITIGASTVAPANRPPDSGGDQCRLPAWARNMVAEELAERERLQHRAELERAGLL